MDKRKSILLRVAPELWDALNRWAHDELRSVNAQIEYVLREAVRRRTGRYPAAPGAGDAQAAGAPAGPPPAPADAEPPEPPTDESA
ncbi:MAG: hypothetical protein HRU75_10560 [Planctomycetia bacterium]|nr:MAG: hypothetical protein HRU75_10560 [Planctomycetia bacterium]